MKVGVKGLCQKTGILPTTLRAWERRYGALEPERTETGRRLYDDRDVLRVRLLMQSLDRGYRISQVAKLSEKQLKEIIDSPTDGSDLGGDSEGQLKWINQGIDRTVAAAVAFDLGRVNEEVHQARLRMGARDFVLDFISPLFREVGVKVAHGQLTIAQEHGFSAILRSHLGTVLQGLGSADGYSNDSSVSVVLATPEGDLHEFGILLSAILVAVRGAKVHFLGANLPALPLAEAAVALNTSVILLGATSFVSSKQTLSSYLQQLNANIPSGECSLWLGGRNDPYLRQCNRFAEAVYLASLHELDRRLVALIS